MNFTLNRVYQHRNKCFIRLIFIILSSCTDDYNELQQVAFLLKNVNNCCFTAAAGVFLTFQNTSNSFYAFHQPKGFGLHARACVQVVKFDSSRWTDWGTKASRARNWKTSKIDLAWSLSPMKVREDVNLWIRPWKRKRVYVRDVLGISRDRHPCNDVR